MTMALAVAMVACSGAVGKPGEPGPKGEPGDPAPPAPPANLAPQVRSLTFDSEQLREGGDAITVNVASNFYDPDGDDAALVLSFSVAQTARFVDVEHDAGVLTITPVDAGEAVITVTATDGDLTASATLTVTVVDAGDPMYIGSLSGETLTFGGRQTIPGSKIESSFDGEGLTFSAIARPEDAMIVDVDMDNPDDPNEVTITALQTEGTATVTITATDEDGDMASYSIHVEVRASLTPVKSDMIPDPVPLDVGGDSTTVDVAQYFDNHGLEALAYEATADSAAVSLSEIVDGMLTITPESADMVVTVVVTITATNMHGSAMQTIRVTVNPTRPMARGTIPMQTIAAGVPRSLGLHKYFTPGKGSTHDDLTYTAEIVEGTAATALISGGDTLVITAGLTAGSATITVTATDGDDETATQDVSVTVTEASDPPEPPEPNELPRYRTGKTLANMYPIQLISGEVPTSVTPAETADNKSIPLDDYFEDPDGVNSRLTYKVTKTADNPEDTTTTPALVVLDIHSTPASFVSGRTPGPDGLAASGELDGEDDSERTLIIEPRNLGDATIAVEVRDEDGDTATFTFMVKIVSSNSNVVPIVVGANDIQDQTGPAGATASRETHTRMKIGDERTVIDSSKTTPASTESLNKFSDYFNDNNFDRSHASAEHNPNERLKITWKVYPATTADGAIADATNGRFLDPREIEAGKRAVTVRVSPEVWSGGTETRFSLMLTAIKGTDNTDGTEANHGQKVALIATDSFGHSVAKVFRVEVNNPPVPYGPMAATQEKDRETLSGYKDFLNLLADDQTAATSPTNTLSLTDSASTPPSVYFSDADNDTLDCEGNFLTSEANKDANKKLFTNVGISDAEVLGFDSTGRTGEGWIKVWCSDGFEETDKEDPRAKLPVEFSRGASIH